MSLDKLARKYKTDKHSGWHNYAVSYEELFKGLQHEPIKLLEIGILKGGSILMWREWFKYATIYGIDLNPDRPGDDLKVDRVWTDKVDQGNRSQLGTYAKEQGPWQIVIDDGSHRMTHQKLSFEVLWEYVEPGGYYVVEDTHTSYWTHRKEFVDSEQTLVEYMLDKANEISSVPTHYDKRYHGAYEIRKVSPKEVLTKWQHEVESITFRSGLIILKKRA